MAEYGEWNRKGATLSDVTAGKTQTELRKIKKEMANLKKRMAELQARRAELEKAMSKQPTKRRR